MKYQLANLLLMMSMFCAAQSKLPYNEIPDYPDTYTAASTVARMVDALGFRYYWATEGLRDEDLDFRPTEAARSSRETLEHIHGLTAVLLNTTKNKVNQSVDVSMFSFQELRKSTLLQIAEASAILKSEDVELADLTIRFEGADKVFPFWNQINGPIADALWHVGQVVTFRRSSGNPFNSKVSVFTGTVRNE